MFSLEDSRDSKQQAAIAGNKKQQAMINPSKFLQRLINSVIFVRLHNGPDYAGTFIGIDDRLNIMLHKGSVLEGKKVLSQHKELLIRGSNILYVTTLNQAS